MKGIKGFVTVLCITAMLSMAACGSNQEAAGAVSKESEVVEVSVEMSETAVEATEEAAEVAEATAEATEEAVEVAEVTEVSEAPTVVTENTEEIMIEESIEEVKDEVVIDKVVALTFDDGPSYITTKILDILESYEIKGTFFLIGKNINAQAKPIMERQIEMGCELANHSYSWESMDKMTDAEIKDSIEKTSALIKDYVGVDVVFFRPPNLAMSNQMYESIDLAFIQGIGCNDWMDTVDAETRANTVLNNVKDGSIVLLHDFYGNEKTVEALPTIIEGLKEQGYTFMTLSEMFAYKNVDPNVENKIWTTVK